MFIVFAKPIFGCFTDSAAIIKIGTRGLIASSIFFITFGFQMIYATLFLALGKGREGAFLSLLRQGICLVPILLTLPKLIGLDGVLFAQGIADLVASIITAIFVIKFYKELNNREEQITLEVLVTDS